MYSRIVVPLDGSELSEMALPHALRLATALNVPVHLARVVESSVQVGDDPDAMTYAYVTMGDYLTAGTKAAVAYLDERTSDLQERGYDVSSEVLVGPVVASLLAVIRPDDLIVMCSQGRSGLRRLVLGSVAESVVRGSTVPVHLVKPDQTAGKA